MSNAHKNTVVITCICMYMYVDARSWFSPIENDQGFVRSAHSVRQHNQFCGTCALTNWHSIVSWIVVYHCQPPQKMSGNNGYSSSWTLDSSNFPGYVFWSLVSLAQRCGFPSSQRYANGLRRKSPLRGSRWCLPYEVPVEAAFLWPICRFKPLWFMIPHIFETNGGCNAYDCRMGL